MLPITYRVGDATSPQERPAIIAHIANDSGGWGSGFVLAVSKKWKQPERNYRAFKHALGSTQIIGVDTRLWVANMIAQHGYVSAGRPCAIDHDMLARCLGVVHWEANERGASVHMPRIGCGLGGSTWEVIEPLIIEQLSRHDIPVFVYDLTRS